MPASAAELDVRLATAADQPAVLALALALAAAVVITLVDRAGLHTTDRAEAGA